jgi:hypothetical protein
VNFDPFEACEDHVAWSVAAALEACRGEGEVVWKRAESAAKLAAEAVGTDAYHRHVEKHGQRQVVEGTMRMTVPNVPFTRADERRVLAVEEKAQAADLRELVGNPFRPPPDGRWLTPAVVSLARAIAQERRYGDLPVLADALEEAGCDDPMLLGHCRRPGGHGLACWALEGVRAAAERFPS